MLMIRFQRIGRTNNAAFRIVVLEKERAAKSSRITDRIGSYNPHSKATSIEIEKAKMWLEKGAQPTDTVRNLFIAKGVMAGKKVNALPSRVAKKKEEPIVEAQKAEAPKAEAVPAEAPVEPAAPAETAPTEAAA